MIDDAFRIEVFVDKEGIVHDEVFIDKVGSDTSKWDYLLTLSPCSVLGGSCFFIITGLFF